MELFRHSEGEGPGEGSGMICAGSQSILLIPSPPLNSMTNDLRGIRVTPMGLEFLTEAPEHDGLKQEQNWIYTETLQLPKVVYIFGGGHCSLALTPILNSLSLRTVVIDDRDDLWTMESNETAWQRIHMDYREAHSLVPDNGQSLVVIMTASHTSDSLVLQQMLSKNLRYLGMMASRVTAKHIFDEMKAVGFPEEKLGTVHSPVGIHISSHTPAEIAVSIASEIIRELNTVSVTT
jgi:xanthine dehydrogenase accessory factor